MLRSADVEPRGRSDCLVGTVYALCGDNSLLTCELDLRRAYELDTDD